MRRMAIPVRGSGALFFETAETMGWVEPSALLGARNGQSVPFLSSVPESLLQRTPHKRGFLGEAYSHRA